MIPLLSGLVRLLTFVLLIVLALLGAGAVVLAVTGGSADVTTALGLPTVRDEVGGLLNSAEAGTGPALALIGGTAAVLLALAILVGALVSPRERLVVLDDGSEGRLGSRRRALVQAVALLATRPREVTGTRVKVRPARRGTGGRLSVRAATRTEEGRPEAERRVSAAVGPLAEAFKLKVRVSTEAASAGREVR